MKEAYFLNSKVKSLSAFFLALCMLFIFVPVNAQAAAAPTRTGKLRVADMTEAVDMLDSEGWKWEPTAGGGVLTLQDCYIQSLPENSGVLELPGGDVTIILNGENTLEAGNDEFNSIIGQGWPTVGGALNLTVQAGENGGSLNVLRQNTSKEESNPYGFAGAKLRIISGDIYCNTDFCVIDEFVMEGGSLTIEESNITDGTGIYADCRVDILGGTIDVNSGYVGIFVPGITDSSDKIANFIGGDVTIKAASAGVYAPFITIDTWGTIDIESPKALILYGKDTGTVNIVSAQEINLKGDISTGSTANGQITISDADYTAVDTAVAEAEVLNSEHYVDFSAVTVAVDAVDRGKDLLHQSEVDAMAQAIEDAIAALEYKPADYSAVDAALERVEALNKDDYKDFTAVEAAVNAVVRGKNITEQAVVDGYAEAIEKAIAALELKPAPDPSSAPSAQPSAAPTETPAPTAGPTATAVPTASPAPTQAPVEQPTATPAPTAAPEGENAGGPKTGDTASVLPWAVLLLVSGTGTALCTVRNKKR